MLLAVATATPPNAYTQAEILERFEITDPRTASIFLNSHIDRRNLFLGDLSARDVSSETQGEHPDTHLEGELDMGSRAILKCLKRAGLQPEDIDYQCCVTTTGFLCPGLSARFTHELGMRPETSRVDVVGMGCNAGLNG